MHLYSHDWTLFYVACNKADEKKPLKVEQDTKKKRLTQNHNLSFLQQILVFPVKSRKPMNSKPCHV